MPIDHDFEPGLFTMLSFDEVRVDNKRSMVICNKAVL